MYLFYTVILPQRGLLSAHFAIFVVFMQRYCHRKDCCQHSLPNLLYLCRDTATERTAVSTVCQICCIYAEILPQKGLLSAHFAISVVFMQRYCHRKDCCQHTLPYLLYLCRDIATERTAVSTVCHICCIYAEILPQKGLLSAQFAISVVFMQ